MKNKLHFIKLFKNPDGLGYIPKESTEHYPLIYLQQFLDDIGKSTESWKKHIKNPRCVGGNISTVSHNEKNISIGDQIRELEPDDILFHATEKEIIEILDTWGKLLKEQPKEIILFQDKDGKTWLEGRDKETPAWIKKRPKYKPMFFAITIYGYEESEENIENSVDLVENFLNKRLKKEIGKAWLNKFSNDFETYGIKNKKDKTVKNIIDLLPEFDWKYEKLESNFHKGDFYEYATWERDKTKQVFVDKTVEKIEISTM